METPARRLVIKASSLHRAWGCHNAPAWQRPSMATPQHGNDGAWQRSMATTDRSKHGNDEYTQVNTMLCRADSQTYRPLSAARRARANLRAQQDVPALWQHRQAAWKWRRSMRGTWARSCRPNAENSVESDGTAGHSPWSTAVERHLSSHKLSQRCLTKESGLWGAAMDGAPSQSSDLFASSASRCRELF